MNKLCVILLFITMLSGCTTNYYGYTKEEWGKLTPEQQTEAKDNIKKLRGQQHNRDLTNKKLNDLFGSISNKF